MEDKAGETLGSEGGVRTLGILRRESGVEFAMGCMEFTVLCALGWVRAGHVLVKGKHRAEHFPGTGILVASC